MVRMRLMLETDIRIEHWAFQLSRPVNTKQTGQREIRSALPCLVVKTGFMSRNQVPARRDEGSELVALSVR